jgi:hypothetical protein
MVFLHQGHEVAGGKVINGEPDDNDHHADNENVDSKQFPDETAFHTLVLFMNR